MKRIKAWLSRIESAVLFPIDKYDCYFSVDPAATIQTLKSGPVVVLREQDAVRRIERERFPFQAIAARAKSEAFNIPPECRG